MDTRPIYAPSDFRLGDGLPGVQRGNADLVGAGTWSPPIKRLRTDPLPVYPQPYDPLFDVLDEAIARIRQMVAECPPAFAGEERRS